MLDTHLQQLFAPVVTALGYELVGVERINQIIRVYIDNAVNGITIGDCEQVSNQIEGILAVENPTQGHYTLEVSSPGLDRPLFTLAQLAHFIGHKVKIRLTQPINAQRTFIGILQQVNDQTITIVADGMKYNLPYMQIHRANLAPDF